MVSTVLDMAAGVCVVAFCLTTYPPLLLLALAGLLLITSWRLQS